MQVRVAMVFGGQHRKCDGGVADVVTENELIEIKNVESWSDGIGQLLKYSDDFPDLRKILYLFGSGLKDADFIRIESACSKAQIEVMRDDVDYPRLLQAYRERTALGSDGLLSAEELYNSISIPIVERTTDLRISTEEFRVYQERAVQSTRYAINAFRHFKPHSDIAAQALLRIYREMDKILAEIQQFAREMNSDAALAVSFVQEMIGIDPTRKNVVPTGKFRDALRDWCEKREYEQYTKLIPLVQDLLEKQGAIFDRQRKGGRAWIGIFLKQAQQSTNARDGPIGTPRDSSSED